MVEFGGDDVELVLGECGQVGVLVQVLAQQPVDVLVGTALPWVEMTSPAGADVYGEERPRRPNDSRCMGATTTAPTTNPITADAPVLTNQASTPPADSTPW
jgi:hypothetical protein